MDGMQTLAEYLAAKRSNARHVGGQFLSFDRLAAEMGFRVFAGNEIELVTVRARGVEDWCFAPNHLLLAGTDRLELITSDPKLTRASLESLDCEGCRETYPEKVVMLRNGTNWVIAEEFHVTVESRHERQPVSLPL